MKTTNVLTVGNIIRPFGKLENAYFLNLTVNFLNSTFKVFTQPEYKFAGIMTSFHNDLNSK